MIGGIHKKTTLVQWVKVTAIDTAASEVVLDRRSTFRVDSDEAWTGPPSLVSRRLRETLSTRGK